MDPRLEQIQLRTRRHFLKQCQLGIGSLGLASLLAGDSPAATTDVVNPLAPKQPHFPAKAKRVIYLHLTGSPPHLDLYDYKPMLVKLDGQPCPDEFIKGKRFAFTTGTPNLLGTRRKFAQYGQGGCLAVGRDSSFARRGRRNVRHQVDDDRSVQPRAGRTAAA